MNSHPDLAIVGAGIVGLAVARAAQAQGMTVAVYEAEDQLSAHQTGRNSGVIHAGVYYAPGSLKAQFCREGAARMVEYCQAEGIAHEICGKLIVATHEDELPRMDALYDRARANGIRISRLSAAEARALEPNITACGALLSPDTGIVDYSRVAARMGERLVANGGRLELGARVIGGSESGAEVTLRLASGQQVRSARAVFCAGLWADRMARMMGAPVDFRIIPFRGEYFRILHQPSDLVGHLIYPVPDPERPFLGVHLTRKMDGGFTVGPNAVLAGARAGYGKATINLRDLGEAVLWPGFWRMLARNAGRAIEELGASVSRRRYLRKVQRYCSQIALADLAPYRPGIRAQAVGRDGRLIDDFLFARTGRTLHVCNAPSPAATACLPIADHILKTLMT